MSTTKVTDRVRELKTALAGKRKVIDQITDSWEVKDGRVAVTGDQHAAYLAQVAEAQSMKQLLDAELYVTGLRAWLDEPEGTPSAPAASGPATKSIGRRFVESDEWQQYKASGYRTSATFVADGSSWFGPEMQGKDTWSLTAGSFSRQGLGSAEQRPLVERLPRRTHVRDLFPADTTNSAVIFSIRQTGFTNGAKPVRERTAADGVSAPTGTATDVFGRAPRSKITAETITYPVSEIKHVDYAHNSALEDEPRLMGLIERNMVEGLRLAEDDQVLFGDGVGANLKGIVNTAGVQIYNQPTLAGPPISAAEKKSVTLRRAITRVQLAEMAATGLILNPLDWEDLELETDNTGRLVLVTSVAIGAEERVWRLPVVSTTAMPEGRYVLGAFGLGAQLYDRRQSAVTVATENASQFEESAITIKASERVALTIDRPEAFVTGTLLP